MGHTHKAIGSTATFLEVRPRVQEHSATTTAVALALEAICVGTQILSKAAAGDANAAQQAHDFVQQRKHKHEHLPAAFWDEFDHLAMLVSPRAPLALSAGSQADMSPPLKPTSSSSLKRSRSIDAATTRSPASASASLRPSPVKSEASEPPSVATPPTKSVGLKRRRPAP